MIIKTEDTELLGSGDKEMAIFWKSFKVSRVGSIGSSELEDHFTCLFVSLRECDVIFSTVEYYESCLLINWVGFH
jgi:hypothetical protein